MNDLQQLMALKRSLTDDGPEPNTECPCGHQFHADGCDWLEAVPATRLDPPEMAINCPACGRLLFETEGICL